ASAASSTWTLGPAVARSLAQARPASPAPMTIARTVLLPVARPPRAPPARVPQDHAISRGAARRPGRGPESARARRQHRECMRPEVPQAALRAPPRGVERAGRRYRRPEPDRVAAGPLLAGHVAEPGPDLRLEP